MRKDTASTVKLDIRLTAEEKEKIRNAAFDKHMTMSEYVRWACEEIFRIQEKNK